MPKSNNAGPSQRMLRVGEQVRHALSDMLQRGEVRDDLIETTVISVSEVRMAPELKIATHRKSTRLNPMHDQTS